MTIDTTRERLRIAVQKSGRLGEPAREVLRSAGLSFRESRDRLFCFGEHEPVDLLLVRDDDIPALLADGSCELGMVGRNVLQECIAAWQGPGPAPFEEIAPLGFGGCRLAIAAPPALAECDIAALEGLRIATSYPALTRQWLAEQGIAVEIVELAGSVEIAPKLGRADAICDLVSSGATLAANQLVEMATILTSEAVLAGPRHRPSGARGALLTMITRRLQGALDGREAKLIMLQVPRAALSRITALLPSAQPPTVTSIDGSADRVALTALCSGQISWAQLENMQRVGASSLMVLPVERMLA